MKNIDYSKLTEITVKTQEELDSIPLEECGLYGKFLAKRKDEK
jgi:hypothetical protein